MASKHEATIPPATRHLLLIAALAAVLSWVSLGGIGLPNYDDCFYSIKARGILETGDWITMHYAGVPDFQHPPLFMWLQALAYAGFGIHDFAARLPSILATVCCIFLVWTFGRRLWNEWAGYAAAIVLATSGPFVKLARRAMMDNLVALWTLCAVVAAWRAVDLQRRRWYLVFGTAVGLGLLTKSVLGAFPLIILPLWLMGIGRSRDLWCRELIGGLVIAGAIASIWFVPELVLHRGSFIDTHFGWIVLGQALDRPDAITGWADRLSYFVELAENYWPWLPVLPFAWLTQWRGVRAGGGDRQRALLLLLWVWVPLLLLSAADKHYGRFMMLVFPALALGVGWQLSLWLGERGRLRFSRIVTTIVALLVLVVLVRPRLLVAEWSVDERKMAPLLQSREVEALARYRMLYYDINNALYYYGGVLADPDLEDPLAVRDWLGRDQGVQLVMRSGDYDQLLAAGDIPHRLLYRGDRYALVTNVP